MPALNTPQFGWVKSRLPRKPQPVPPIFQPEVAARAIVWAADHERAELYVGMPTVTAIVGNKIAPRLADWYLARHGYEAQQTDEPVAPDRVDNLWEPVAGDQGAHGTFGDRARSQSPYLWATTHRGWLALAAAGIAVLGAALVGSRRPAAGSRSGG
jgi:hypothetical protein